MDPKGKCNNIKLKTNNIFRYSGEPQNEASLLFCDAHCAMIETPNATVVSSLPSQQSACTQSSDTKGNLCFNENNIEFSFSKHTNLAAEMKYYLLLTRLQWVV